MFVFIYNYIVTIICNTHSIVFNEATKEITGESKPYSVCGSLPLVYELQQEGIIAFLVIISSFFILRCLPMLGFDLQIAGYGLSAKYHGVNEVLSSFCCNVLLFRLNS